VKKMAKKIKLIKDLKKDEIVNDIFVVKFKKPVDKYRNGYKFELRLGDSSKEIMYKYWGPDDEEKVKSIYDSIKSDNIVHIQGRVNEWNNNLEISANDNHIIKVLSPEEYDVSEFIKQTEKPIEEMWGELIKYIESVKNTDMKKILDFFFKDDGFSKKFKQWPAAMYIHHGWLGGLLEHTLSVVKLCDSIYNIHDKMDKDLLITGAVLHDIGKMHEFEITTSIKVSTKGMLIGHVNIGIDMLNKAMDELKTPDKLRLKLVHILMTHMGEYGNNKLPAFPEALTIFHADQLDAKVLQMATLKEEAQTEDDYVYDKHFGNVYLK